MKGWILYKKAEKDLSVEDHGVNRLRAAAQSQGVILDVYSPEQFDLLSSEKALDVVFAGGKPLELPDFLIPRTGAESSYAALAAIRHIEEMSVYVCNTSRAITDVKDKMHMNQRLRAAGLPSPKTLLLRFPICIEFIEQQIGFPLVIKMISGARGQGIYLCETASQFKDLMELLSLQPLKQTYIVQEFVQESYGCDVRVFVLGGRILGCMKRISNEGFKANFSLGGRVEAYPLNSEIEELALRVAALFQLEIAGIDLLFTKDGFTVCEANSSPGFKGMEQAMNTDIASQIMAYVIQQLK